MLRVNYDKSLVFFQLVVPSYLLLAIISVIIFEVSVFHRDENGTSLVEDLCSRTTPTKILSFHLEFMTQFFIFISTIASFCVVIAAAYYGIHWHFWYQEFETRVKCAHMFQDIIPNIQASFSVIVLLLGLSFVLTISHEIVLLIDLTKEIYSEDPSFVFIIQMAKKIAIVALFSMFNLIILGFSIALHNIFFYWKFFYEDGYSMAQWGEDLFPYADLLDAYEMIISARRETDEPPPEYSSLETDV